MVGGLVGGGWRFLQLLGVRFEEIHQTSKVFDKNLQSHFSFNKGAEEDFKAAQATILSPSTSTSLSLE